MVLPSEVQIGRCCAYKPLRKPLTPTSTSSRNPFTDKVIQGLETKILLLDEDSFKTAGETIKEEILSLLNKGAFTTSACLQFFLDTAWKDRSRNPMIAKIFHNIAQLHDDESATGLTALLEKCCNDLLNILTLLGKPGVNDLRIVSLLSNLYRLEDLPEEHREGVESYLVDIAKAFWPYFVPQKHEVWDNELVADAICDVFHTVGSVLEEKCPVNMERTFNKITAMLISKKTISMYTRCRLLEVKERRAKGWTLQECASNYYRAAFLKHPKDKHSSRSPSPTSPTPITTREFLSDDKYEHPKDKHSSRSPSPTSPTPITTREFLSNDKYEVTVHGKPRHPLVIRIKHKPLPEQNNNISSEANNSTTNIVSSPTTKRSEEQRLLNISNQEHTDYSEIGEISTPKSRESQDQKCCFGSLIGSDEFKLQASKDFHERRKSFEKISESPNESDTTNSTPGRSTPDEYSPTVLFSSPFNDMVSSSSPFEEKSPNKTGGFSKYPSFSRGFSCPETNSPPSFSESPFSRHNSFGNDNTSSRQRLSSTGEMSHQRRTPFHRSHSESSAGDSPYSRWGQSPNGCDSTGFGHPDGGSFSFGRPKYHMQSSNYRRSNLEFPVKKVLEGEDVDTSSRLYLLSFATSPAALERPADLTLTPEVEAEKEWLKCLILDEPITVLHRFGQ